MGREIRKVKAGWEHPKYTEENAPRFGMVGQYIPMYDRDFETEASNWVSECVLWAKGEHPDQHGEDPADEKFYWQWNGGPPEELNHRPKWNESEMTHFQVYETVSEGTPVTPAFATKEELVEYLSTKGTYWDHGQPWDRESARRFVEAEWAPSMILGAGGVKRVNEAGFYPSPVNPGE